MSKFEILQNKKVSKEIDYIKNQLYINEQCNYKVDNYNILSNLLSIFFIDFLKLFVILVF